MGVLVVGSFNLDHVWISDTLPAPGATRLGRYLSGPGGKGFNQAIAAARAGAATVFITALGDDAAAEVARTLAKQEGLQLQAQRVADAPSGTAGIFVDGEGRNSIVVAPGANERLSADFIRERYPQFAGAKVVLAQLEVAGDAVFTALVQAHRVNALAVLNPAPANAQSSPELLALADVLTPNETEFAALLARHHGLSLDAERLATLDDASLHQHCRRLSPATVVITLGAQGVLVSHGANSRGDTANHYRLPAEAVTAIDTTGAGDAFSGALCAALASQPNAPFIDAVQFANRYAALSTEHRGAALAMPTREVVEKRFNL